MILSITAALILAASMNLQQYALAGPEEGWIFKYIRRNILWVGGLCVYLSAQLIFVAALGMGVRVTAVLFSGLSLMPVFFVTAFRHHQRTFYHGARLLCSDCLQIFWD